MIDNKVDKTFAKKFNLVGKGQPVVISPYIKDRIKMLEAQSNASNIKNEFITKYDKTRYK